LTGIEGYLFVVAAFDHVAFFNTFRIINTSFDWHINCCITGMTNESIVLGKRGEDIAVEYLRGKGYVIIERNFHSQQGEIDIIGKEGDMLVFVEVKSYSYRSYGTPIGALRRAKKESIIHAARTYLYKNNIRNLNCRFDVLAIMDNSRFQLIKGAFDVS